MVKMRHSRGRPVRPRAVTTRSGDASPTVLLVDDHQSQCVRMREGLAPYGISLECRPNYREAAAALRDPELGRPIDLILIDQVFDSIPTADLVSPSEVDQPGGGWDVQLHQGLLILSRFREDMRKGRVPATPMMILTHDAGVKTAAGALAAHESKQQLLADPYRALKRYLPRLQPAEVGAADQDDPAPSAPASAASPDILVALAGPAPTGWTGEVVPAGDVGRLCSRRPDCLAVWTGADAWIRGCWLLGMIKSVVPEKSIVLTGARARLELVPSDVWVATVEGGRAARAERGHAHFTCADLRSDWIFRLMLSGRARRSPELRPLLDLHVLTATGRGVSLVERWRESISALFAGSGRETMPDGLRAGLEELAGAARDAEHAVIGGYHMLDPVVRDGRDWEEGARRYLTLAASRSAGASAEVHRWLASTAGWTAASRRTQEARRRIAAAALQRLADDPWLPAGAIARVLFQRAAS